MQLRLAQMTASYPPPVAIVFTAAGASSRRILISDFASFVAIDATKLPGRNPSCSEGEQAQIIED
ncbi:MAG: hypothetical protein HOO95_06895 [Gallionella sp.]|nr:hypothetical protein [Gallionella sp.]